MNGAKIANRWTAAACAAFLFLAVPAVLAKTAKEQGMNGKDIARKLMCQCGCSMVAAECNHVNCPSAPKLIARAQELVERNLTVEQILDEFVEEYGGEHVLSAPPFKGRNRIAYIAPYAGLVLVALLVGMAVIGWTRNRRRADPLAETPEGSPSPGEENGDPHRERMRKELKEYDV